MRQGQNTRRTRGRSGSHRNQNGKPNSSSRQQNGQGNRKNHSSPNRQFESHGPDGKNRGTAAQLCERYKTLAREVTSSDRILAEAFSQFADHYYRTAAEIASYEQEIAARREAARENNQGARQDTAENRGGNSDVSGQESDQESGGESGHTRGANGADNGQVHRNIPEDRGNGRRSRLERPAQSAPTESSAPQADTGKANGQIQPQTNPDRSVHAVNGRGAQPESGPVEPGAANDMVSAPVPAPKRPRGRPPRKAATSETADQNGNLQLDLTDSGENTVKTNSSESKPKTVRRKIVRKPRVTKTAESEAPTAAADTEPSTDEVPKPKRRGRPRKTPLPAEASAE